MYKIKFCRKGKGFLQFTARVFEIFHIILTLQQNLNLKMIQFFKFHKIIFQISSAFKMYSKATTHISRKELGVLKLYDKSKKAFAYIYSPKIRTTIL